MPLITPGAGTPLSSIATMHQAPMPPWRTDEEKQDYIEDPKQFLLDRCALWMNAITVYHNWIITATYYLPPWQDLPSGFRLHFPEKVFDEALWQGKIGLVVAKGPLAFLSEGGVDFHGQDAAIGDWVQYDIMEGRQFTMDRVHCRRLKDTQLVLNLNELHPNIVY